MATRSTQEAVSVQASPDMSYTIIIIVCMFLGRRDPVLL